MTKKTERGPWRPSVLLVVVAVLSVLAVADAALIYAYAQRRG